MDSVNKLVVPFPRINFNMKNRFSYSSYDTIFQGVGGGEGRGVSDADVWVRIFSRTITVIRFDF